MQPIIFTTNAAEELRKTLSTLTYDHLFILCDENTAKLCLPQINGQLNFPSKPKINNVNEKRVSPLVTGAYVNGQWSIITIPAGDTNKNLQSISHVWQQLQAGGATRHSVLVNLGGGMVTDLGGFAASTFKRGIRFINIPTTLLSMVDASVGGKTGINFGGLKNEIGVFNDALRVIIDTHFLSTLDNENKLSGYAEMLKHSLISTAAEWAELINGDPLSDDILPILEKNIRIKERIVEADPREQGLRKALNLGHTFGHAFESFAMGQGSPVLHGYAVAWGIVCELYLSVIKQGFPTDKMRQTVSFIRNHYGMMTIECKHYDQLFELMTHDKKNSGSEINFTILADIGDLRLNQTATRDEIFEALDFFRETL